MDDKSGGGEKIGTRGASRKFAATMPDATRSLELVWQDPLASAGEGAGLSGLEYMSAIAAGEIPPPPIAVLLDMGPVEVAEGKVTFSGKPGEEHYNPIGIVHGGYAATVLDSAIGCAVHTTLPQGEIYASLGLEVKYLRAITRDTGEIRCTAEVTYRGGRQATAEARLYAASDSKLLATGTGTCLIFTPGT
jgi:uncharacterized protein (TIGR00369 family)